MKYTPTPTLLLSARNKIFIIKYRRVCMSHCCDVRSASLIRILIGLLWHFKILCLFVCALRNKLLLEKTTTSIKTLKVREDQKAETRMLQ